MHPNRKKMAKEIHRKIVLSVSGKEAENSFSGLSKTVRSLERELKKLTPGTHEFMKKSAELKEARGHFERVKNEINSVNRLLDETPEKAGRFRKFLNGLGDVFKQVFAVNRVEDLFQSIITGGKKAIDNLLKVSDAMAGVQKTTGMALNEVKQLWDAFDEMDTRTSKLDRLKIAEVGGRLGVSKEEMKTFVQEIDKVFVALGDSYQGGLEQIVRSNDNGI